MKRQVRERRRAAEIVAAKEAELRDMFERSPVSVIITNPEGAVRYANSSWLRLFNISKDALAEFRVENLHFDPAKRQEFVRSLQQSGSVREVEFTVKRSDGQPVHVLLSADLYNYRGEMCIVNWFIDITARKAVEETLSTAEEQLRAALDNMSDGLYMVDQDLRVLLVNERYRKYVGYPDGIMVRGQSVYAGMRFRALRGDYGPGDPDVLIERRIAAMRRGARTHWEDVVCGRTLDTHRAPTADGGAVAVVRDVTDQKNAQQALAEAEGLLRDMANSVPGAVFQLRVTADGGRAYTFISDGVLDLSGIAAEEARRDYDILWRLVFDEDKQPFEQAILLAISTVKPITHDFRILRPDGGVRWMPAFVP